MKISATKISKRTRRHKKIRKILSGTAVRPRLAVFKSNRFIYAQLIDDIKSTTLGAATSKGMKKKALENAKTVGELIAKIALDKKITKVVFDRGGFVYTGHIKALADGARAGGLEF